VRDTGEELGSRLMQTSQIVIELTVLVLAIFVGVEVISKVPTLLHTPLMSGTNAIHGIVLVGAIIVAGLPHQVTWIRVVALTAVALGTINVVGGFVVTDRMLAMFKGKRRDAEPAQPAIGEGGRVERVRENREARATSTSDHDGR
jgi:H+-translocating NAD(P) transhydrogenase subunit alpha